MQNTKIALSMFLLVIVTSCATITKGSTQNIYIQTDRVEAADCTIIDGTGMVHKVVTPGMIHVQKSKNPLDVRCKKEGYRDGIMIVPSNFQEMTAGNFIAGGIIGLGIDAASGAMNKYNPNVIVPMYKIEEENQ